MPNDNLNGSVDLLARSLRDVFGEAMTDVRNGMKADLKAMETGLRKDMKEMEERLNTRIDTTNENMAAQFTQQEKKMGDMIDKKLAG